MTTTETELKLKILNKEAWAAALSVVGDAPALEMTSVYFDTAEGLLGREGYSLRVRTVDGARIQTLKGPFGPGRARLEIEAAAATAWPDPAFLRGTPARAVLGSALVLAPQFTLKVTRRARTSRVGDAVIEYALDQGEAVWGEARAPLLELELELKEGAPEALFAEARRLSREAPLVLDFGSKAALGRSLAPAGAKGPEAQGLETKGPGVREPRGAGAEAAAPKAKTYEAMTAGALLSSRIRTLVEDLARAASAVREAGSVGQAGPFGHRALEAGVVPEDAFEAVHQVRVSLRRVKVILGAYKAQIEAARLQSLIREIRWLAGAFADVRELDVFGRDQVGPALGLGEEPQAMAALGAALAMARSRALQAAAGAVDRARFRVFLVDLCAFAEADLPSGAACDGAALACDAGAFATDSLDRRLKAFRRRARDLDFDDAAACHTLRIEAKKLRYAAETFAFAARSAKHLRRFSKTLKAAQDALGLINDLRMAPFTATLALETASGELERPAAYAAGFLVGRATAARPAAARQGRRAAAALLEAQPFWGPP